VPQEGSFRFDVTVEILSMNDETGEVEFVLRPNPDRYEWREIEGEQRLYDKFDRLLFPKEVLAQMAEQLRGLPITYEAPRIKDAKAYIESRRGNVEAMLEGTAPEHGLSDKSGEFLDALAGDELGFVILSIDVVGSTGLATSVDAAVYRTVIRTLLYELSETIPLFNGHVLKYTGDGLVAYFPEPSFMRKNDLAIDCALTLRGLVRDALNPALRERGWPEIDVRIGIDAGQAFVETLGSPETKRHRDIIGEVVNLAVKLQAQAQPGGICLGQIAVQNLHTEWRKVCEDVDPPAGWAYTDARGDPYRFYRFGSSA
jgi:adenylate cyclase